MKYSRLSQRFTNQKTVAAEPNSRQPARLRRGPYDNGVNSTLIRWTVLWVAVCLSGCAAFHPIKGMPARYVPAELKAASRSGKRTINLSLLQQSPPAEYFLDTGDVLGIYIKGVLPETADAAAPGPPPPVNFPVGEEGTPSLGYPIRVREDGTISIPMIDPIYVRAMTLRQVEDVIRRAYTKGTGRDILREASRSISVSLQKPRTYRVLVIRQEAASEFATGGGGGSGINLGSTKRGTGRIVNLRAYENDVLHALAQTGGPPGLDAENSIYIIRNRNRARPPRPLPNWPMSDQPHPRRPIRPNPLPKTYPVPILRPRVPPSPIQQTAAVMGLNQNWRHSMDVAAGPQFVPQQPYPENAQRWGHTLPQRPQSVYPMPPYFAQNFGPWSIGDPTMQNPDVIKIPFRLDAGQSINFSEVDIILGDGDIVFIESRDTEIFYTGGLLGGGQYTLPRDYDLDILGAISIAQAEGRTGGATRAVGGISALNQDVTVSASNVIILRRLPNGTQVPIKVDLYRAVQYPEERVIIQPGDYIILQYTPLEAIAAFFERHILEGAIFGIAASQIDRR